MKYVRAFIAGIALPSLVLPIALWIMLIQGDKEILSVPVLHFIPVIWGMWNILYFAFFTHFLPKNQVVSFLITGAVLGLVVALYVVFNTDLPLLLGISKEYSHLPLIVGPILYAILWSLAVRPLNELVGLQDK